jgi:hypothetical protein
MFCPRCGRGIFDTLFGGTCAASCVYCGKAVNCYDTFTGERDPDSMLINNPVKAGVLARKYDKEHPGAKEEGKKRIKEHREFYRQVKRNSRGY